MTNPFHPDDAENLVAPHAIFSDAWPAAPGGKPVVVAHARRAALALEIACQLALRLPGMVLKGGTALQARLGWPPARASIDIDLEWHDTNEVVRAVHDIADTFAASDLQVQEPQAMRMADKLHLTYPLAGAGPVAATRIDIAAPGTATRSASQWKDPPRPWNRCQALRLPSLEAHAAQKLLLASDAPFGRNTARPEGRQNLMKDWFDLHCLGGLDLDSQVISEVIAAEVTSKGSRLEGTWDVARVAASAQATYRRMAASRADAPDEEQALWRAYLKVRPFIRAPFADDDLRRAAGCSHHAVATLLDGNLDWADAWTPMRTRGPRKAWHGTRPLATWMDVPDDFGTVGLREAWTRPFP